MNRRQYLGGLTGLGFLGIAGCLQITDPASETQGDYETDPSAVEFEYECQEAILLKDVVRLSGRAISPFLGTSAVEWHIEMQPDIDFKINVYLVEGDEYARLPALQVIAPDGAVLIDASHPESESQAFSTNTGGVYTIRALKFEWTTVNTWRYRFAWYNETGCTRYTLHESGRMHSALPTGS